MTDQEKTAAELAEEERQAAIARGDIVEDTDEEESDEDDVQDTDTSDSGDVGEGAEGSGESDDEDEEDDAEDSADGDAEASDEDAADDPEGEDKPKPIMIPKARFDEAARKAKDKADALQAKLDKLESQHEKEVVDTDLATLETEIETLEDEWTAELLEGELDKAKAVQKQIRTKRKLLNTKMLTQQSQQTGNAAIEQIRFDHQLAEVEARYPQLNPDHADVNVDLINEVNEMMSMYTAGGFTHTKALQKAVYYVIRDEDAEPTKDPAIEKSKRGQKARKAVSKAAKQSPPDITKAGRDSDKGGKGDGLPDVTKMSPEQFAKLSDAELAKLRGDTLSDEEAA